MIHLDFEYLEYKKRCDESEEAVLEAENVWFQRELPAMFWISSPQIQVGGIHNGFIAGNHPQ